MCLRLKKNKLGYGSVGVFPPTGPMHLISTLNKILLASTIKVSHQTARQAKNMGDTFLRVTISRGARFVPSG
jgi:hypothetical protein